MTHDPIARRRHIKVVAAVLAVGIVMAALVALGLIYMARMHPGT
jgi:hypothetical protein